MLRPLIVVGTRLEVINHPRWHLPVGTRGTIWQAHENPAGERVGRILWDNKEEGHYWLERIPETQLGLVYDQPPTWAVDTMAEWERGYLPPKITGPMAKLLRGFKSMLPNKGKGGPWG